MAIEDDAITLLQGLLMIAGPILVHRTLQLWQGILEGGIAKTQAAFIFCTDPITILSVVVCVGIMIVFWTFMLLSRKKSTE